MIDGVLSSVPTVGTKSDIKFQHEVREKSEVAVQVWEYVWEDYLDMTNVGQVQNYNAQLFYCGLRCICIKLPVKYDQSHMYFVIYSHSEEH